LGEGLGEPKINKNVSNMEKDAVKRKKFDANFDREICVQYVNYEMIGKGGADTEIYI
jgi:hypothetical protein